MRRPPSSLAHSTRLLTAPLLSLFSCVLYLSHLFAPARIDPTHCPLLLLWDHARCGPGLCLYITRPRASSIHHPLPCITLPTSTRAICKVCRRPWSYAVGSHFHLVLDAKDCPVELQQATGGFARTVNCERCALTLLEPIFNTLEFEIV
ncbi:hypothetical protein HDK64DRAFT_260827 [Phyllosticta capitalensis]